MAQGNDLPSQDANVELDPIGFDFGPQMAAGEYITSLVALTCAVVAGYDPNPNSHLIGSPAIVSSTGSGSAFGQVNQRMGGLLGGVTYLVQCVVLTSQANKLSLWTHISAVTPS